MKRYTISVDGCDDSSIFDLMLTDEQAETARLIAEACTNTSTYRCMPTMTVELTEQLELAEQPTSMTKRKLQVSYIHTWHGVRLEELSHENLLECAIWLANECMKQQAYRPDRPLTSPPKSGTNQKE